jgi:hypothetical protein
MQSRKHSFEHIACHLTAHALPALDLLGFKPGYPLAFANRFIEPPALSTWLSERDWSDAWLEGNNLLFIGQFLLYLKNVDGVNEAEWAFNQLMNWLDYQVDPETGLWGTNGYCSIPAAVYGGYHQLLLYYYTDREIRSAERLVDTVLKLQHEDGGFHPSGGGGACEDIDAIDILVNLYKKVDHRRPAIRVSLRKALTHILRMQMNDGGFVYRMDQPFIHMGIKRTASAANVSNLFPTWFRIHSLALLGEVLTDTPTSNLELSFNRQLSMGWHRSWNKAEHRLGYIHRMEEKTVEVAAEAEHLANRLLDKFHRIAGSAVRMFKQIAKRIEV